MVLEGLRGYVQALAGVAGDILATASGSRGSLPHLVRAEVQRSVAALGLTPPAEVERMRERIQVLERRVEQLEAAPAPAASRISARTPTRSVGTKAAAGRAPGGAATPRPGARQAAARTTTRKAAATTASPAAPPPLETR